MKDDYAFKIWNPETGKEYKIYADGRISGFEHESAIAIVNKIPTQAARDIAQQSSQYQVALVGECRG